MKRLKTVSIIISILGVASALVWLLIQNLAPSGVLVLHWRPGVSNPFVGPLVPESRLSPPEIARDGTPYQSLVVQPINFNVRLPISFDTAKVSVTMAGDPAIAEIGGLSSRQTWTYDLHPAVSSAIDNLGWPIALGRGLALYQREKKYSSIEEFLASPPPETALYRANVDLPANIPGYVPSKNIAVYRTAFRGATTIKAYLEDERLDFSFNVQDVNRHAVDDGFEAAAYLNGRRIAGARLDDDGNMSGNGKLSPLREVRLYTDAPVSGVVRIDLSAGDDIVFRETATAQRKFVFSNRFYAADNVGYGQAPAAFSIMTDGKRLHVTTSHPEAFQTLSAGGRLLAIDDVNKAFSIALADKVRKNGMAEIASSYGDLRLETAGSFAFGSDNMFRAQPQSFTWETDVDKDGIDYILTSYVAPPRGEWRTASATFDLAALSAANRAYNFTISVPGIETQKNELRLASIDIELRRPPLTPKDLFKMLLSIIRSSSVAPAKPAPYPDTGAGVQSK